MEERAGENIAETFGESTGGRHTYGRYGVAVARADDGTETFDEANGVVINADGVGHGGEDDSPFPLLVPRRSRRKTAGSRQSLQFGR